MRHKIQSQRGRAEFLDGVFTAAYKIHALMHHCNKTFCPNKVLQENLSYCGITTE